MIMTCTCTCIPIIMFHYIAVFLPNHLIALHKNNQTTLFQIAEQLKATADKLPKDIQDETRVAFAKLFQESSVFLLTRERFRASCASILVKHHQLFPTGWHQIALVYYGE